MGMTLVALIFYMVVNTSFMMAGVGGKLAAVAENPSIATQSFNVFADTSAAGTAAALQA